MSYLFLTLLFSLISTPWVDAKDKKPEEQKLQFPPTHPIFKKTPISTEELAKKKQKLINDGVFFFTDQEREEHRKKYTEYHPITQDRLINNDESLERMIVNSKADSSIDSQEFKKNAKMIKTLHEFDKRNDKNVRVFHAPRPKITEHDYPPDIMSPPKRSDETMQNIVVLIVASLICIASLFLFNRLSEISANNAAKKERNKLAKHIKNKKPNPIASTQSAQSHVLVPVV